MSLLHQEYLVNKKKVGELVGFHLRWLRESIGQEILEGLFEQILLYQGLPEEHKVSWEMFREQGLFFRIDEAR